LPLLSGVAACATTPTHGIVQEEAALTCPTPTAGSVTGQTGMFTGFVDAELTGLRVPEFQWQYPVRLASTPGICLKHRAGTFGADGETRLIVALTGYSVVPGSDPPQPIPSSTTPVPYPPVPVTVRPHTAVESPAGSGFGYGGVGTWIPVKGSQQDATGGTVTFTYLGDDRAEGSYDLTFKAGRVAGTFVAPYCVLC
jgi:hypothetical protein